MKLILFNVVWHPKFVLHPKFWNYFREVTHFRQIYTYKNRLQKLCAKIDTKFSLFLFFNLHDYFLHIISQLYHFCIHFFPCRVDSWVWLITNPVWAWCQWAVNFNVQYKCHDHLHVQMYIRKNTRLVSWTHLCDLNLHIISCPGVNSVIKLCVFVSE